jgi:hypothetical protein
MNNHHQPPVPSCSNLPEWDRRFAPATAGAFYSCICSKRT